MGFGLFALNFFRPMVSVTSPSNEHSELIKNDQYHSQTSKTTNSTTPKFYNEECFRRMFFVVHQPTHLPLRVLTVGQTDKSDYFSHLRLQNEYPTVRDKMSVKCLHFLINQKKLFLCTSIISIIA